MASKIAFFISEIRRGGAERVLVNLANAFCNNGYDVTFITRYRNNDEYTLDRKIFRIVISEYVDRLSKYKMISVVKDIFFIRGICKKYNINVLISFMANNNFRAILSSLYVCKCIISVRNDPRQEYYSRVLKIIAGILYPFADRYVFQTKAQMEYFPQKYWHRSSIIYNPVSDYFYRDRCTNNLERTGIVAVGRLEAQKNHQMLIESYMKLCERGIHEKLYIYGDGSLREELKEIVSRSKLNEKIFFMGNVGDIKEKIKKAKLFVMSSDYEGMPNALMEALAIGIPVVCTDCPIGGPRELVHNGINGFLCKTKDVDDLAVKMEEVIKSQYLQETFSQNAMKYAGLFHEKEIFNQWEKLILNLFGEN